MTAQIGDAQYLWIDAGAMSGGPRHQTEFADDVAEFFDDDTRQMELINIRLPDGSIHVRPFTYRGEEHHWTEIWRISLPTAAMGGPDYQHRVIRFSKVYLGRGVLYDVEAADVGSSEALAWEDETSTNGTVGQTGSGAGRRYGWR